MKLKQLAFITALLLLALPVQPGQVEWLNPIDRTWDVYGAEPEWLKPMGESTEIQKASNCNSMSDCGFLAAQACQHRNFADVSYLHYDSTASKNACMFICTDGNTGRFPSCGRDRGPSGRECNPDFYPESSCHRCYHGPPDPCCEWGDMGCDIPVKPPVTSGAFHWERIPQRICQTPDESNCITLASEP